MKPPNRSPDAEVVEVTSRDQAVIYRLSGDLNPHNIDPAVAAKQGLKKPILTGLCMFGYAARHVMKTFAKNEPWRLKAIKVGLCLSQMCQFAFSILSMIKLVRHFCCNDLLERKYKRGFIRVPRRYSVVELREIRCSPFGLF